MLVSRRDAVVDLLGGVLEMNQHTRRVGAVEIADSAAASANSALEQALHSIGTVVGSAVEGGTCELKTAEARDEVGPHLACRSGCPSR